jgi:hypothetical protein
MLGMTPPKTKEISETDKRAEMSLLTFRDRDVLQQIAELFVVTNSQIDVTRDDALAMVVMSSISSSLHNLSDQVF